MSEEEQGEEYPKTGVSIDFLKDFVTSIQNTLPEFKTANTNDVCNAVVKPFTQDTGLSYVQKYQGGDGGESESRKQQIGPATHFVSHAWRYNFGDMISAIEIFHNSLPQEQQDSGNTYYWIDLFTIDQHNAVSRPHSWWSTTFIDAIRSFHRVVLVFQPFLDPVPLQRAWCLWELFAAITTNADIQLAMPAEEWTAFRFSLRENYPAVIEMIHAIDARKAEAFNPHDQVAIFKAIEEVVGFDKLNEFIRKKISDVLLCGAVRESARDKNYDRVSRLVELAGDINTVATFLTPLGVAVEMGDVELVKVILSHGANVNAPMAHEQTALHLAARHGHHDIVSILLQAGGDQILSNIFGRTAVQEAQNAMENLTISAGEVTYISSINDDALRIANDAFEAALLALHSLTRMDITECKSFSNPYNGLMKALQLGGILCGVLKKDTSWGCIKKTFLSKLNFINELVSFLNQVKNREVSVPAEDVSRAKTILDLVRQEEGDGLFEDIVKSRSQLGWAIVLFSKAVLGYIDYFALVDAVINDDEGRALTKPSEDINNKTVDNAHTASTNNEAIGVGVETTATASELSSTLSVRNPDAQEKEASNDISCDPVTPQFQNMDLSNARAVSQALRENCAKCIEILESSNSSSTASAKNVASLPSS